MMPDTFDATTTRPVLVDTGGTEAGWLAARRQGITASEIAVVMGLSPYDSPFALWHRKRGDLPEIEDSDILERGRILEPYIADKFQASHQDLYIVGDGRELYAHPCRPWQMATPDRLVHDRYPVGYEPIAVLECKTDAGGDGWGDEGTDEIPVHYRCQVLWQMDVLGVQAAYVACLSMRSWKLRVYELTIDMHAAGDLALMRHCAQEFLNRPDPPGPDWRLATTDALKRLHPSLEDRDAVVGVRTAISYRAACRRYKEAERRKNEMTNRLRAEMGSAARAVTRHGDTVATRQVYEVREHTRKAGTTDKLIPARGTS